MSEELKIPVTLSIFFNLGFLSYQGKGEAISYNSSLQLAPPSPLHRHLGISRVITADSAPLHIANSRTQSRNLWFPRASR